jgi:hypothetical protein
VKCTLDERPSIFIRDKSIFLSERMLHKDYYRRSSVEKKSLVMGLKGLDAKINCQLKSDFDFDPVSRLKPLRLILH